MTPMFATNMNYGVASIFSWCNSICNLKTNITKIKRPLKTTTLNIVFIVTYNLELQNVVSIYYVACFFFGQQWSIWLFGHSKIITKVTW